MYQIYLKIPKEYYSIEQIVEITNDALVISRKFGEIAVSNDAFELIGYIGSTEPDMSGLQSKYEHIEVLIQEAEA